LVTLKLIHYRIFKVLKNYHNSFKFVTSSSTADLLFKPDFSTGTLWRVREDIWINNLSKYDKESSRKWHPGLSIANQKTNLGNETTIPVLHGSSGKSGPVVVAGITSEEPYSEDHKCVFGKILQPVLLNRSKMEELDRTGEVFNQDLGKRWYETFEVIPNRYKPRINADENNQLKSFLERKMAEDE